MRATIGAPIVLVLAAVASAADPAYPPLPKAVSSFGAVVCDGYVYVYGGHAGRTHTYSTETTSGKFRRLNLAHPEKGWEELQSGPHLQGLALVAHKGHIYRIGGMRPRNMPGEIPDNHSVTSFARFDPAEGRWEHLADLPAGRSSHDAVVVGDTLIVVGGWRMTGESGKTQWHDTMLTFDLSNTDAKWQTAPQPFKRRALSAAVLDGKVYVFAGLTADGGTSHDVNVFDPVTRKWSEAPKVPGDRMNGFTPASAVLDGKLYISPADGVVYRLAGDRWESTAKLATPRLVHRIVPVGKDTLLVLGGASKAGNVAATEAISVGVK